MEIGWRDADAKLWKTEEPREKPKLRSATLSSIRYRCLKKFNLPLYIAFVDYKKAFDSLEHASVFQALVNQGVKTKYVRLLKTIYSQSTAKVKTEKVGQTFTLGRGVKQGDPISPKLFTCVLEGIFRKLQWSSKCGITVNGRRLTNLRFADDVVLFATSHKQLQQMLRELNEISKSTGLEMNFSKTQLMTNKAPIPIKLEGTELNYSQHEEILTISDTGQLPTACNVHSDQAVMTTETQNKARIYCITGRFGQPRSNIGLVKTPMASSVSLGSRFDSTFTLTLREEQRLRVFENKVLRKIFGSKRVEVTGEWRKLQDTELHALYSSPDIIRNIKTRRLRWARHVARMGESRMHI
ncbi:hypothetical protein ANN_10058 [Periplaneta americana]|uniref:Reverse transcriptase domain-containing protein n=1 Tax=Periplaneta americana TaxID=6978 RepID=A0ABQ8TN07_PERAM|nr:hypothetical protein ANN_10058 [Periplaneta americana]